MAKRFNAMDLCFDGFITSMWTPDCNRVFVSLKKTLYNNCFSPPRSKWVHVIAELVVAFD